jgi:hypothetical protein
MKKLSFISVILVLLLFVSNGIQAQNVASNLDQLKLMEQWLGTWQQDIGKDTVEIWEVQLYEKAFISTGHILVKGKKSFDFAEDWSFSHKLGKFKGYLLWADGSYSTWIGSFTTEKKLSGDWIWDFNPEAVKGKFEAVLETPKSMTITQINTKGVKVGGYKLNKIK